MLLRMENWIDQMEWDWCISRQRIFATPIPVWSCAKCGELVVPDEKDLPCDPTLTQPKHPCPKCGGTAFEGEVDVLDTWMDSSISVLNVTGWDGAGLPKIFPAQIRPQGHDIIRTWAFYSILRSVALTGSRPWDQILVNGMVLGEDGFKMSKSRGNVIVPEDLIGRYGADALRQWAATGAAMGSDIMFSWNDVIAASRFQTKMWNIARFALIQFEKEGIDKEVPVTALADRWLLARLSATVVSVSAAMENYEFDEALKAIREFAWDVLADNYIELVKGRLYGSGASRKSACYVLYTAYDALCRMLAPFIPYFAEECYSYLDKGSVHKQPWVTFSFDDPAALAEGNLLVNVVAEVRKYKHDNGLALNAPLGKVTVYATHSASDEGDTARTLNADVHWKSDKAHLDKVVAGIDFNRSIVGPTFRKDAGVFMEAVKALSPEELANPPQKINVNGKTLDVPENAFTLRVLLHGRGCKSRYDHSRRCDCDDCKVNLIASATKQAISSFSRSASTTTNREGSMRANARYRSWTFSRSSRRSKCSLSLLPARRVRASSTGIARRNVLSGTIDHPLCIARSHPSGSGMTPLRVTDW